MTAAESSVRIRSGRSAFALRRPRLEERLDDVFGKRVGLVVAGAGYGKSTLVASWSEDLNAAWHVLGPTDSELASFLEKLLPALSRAGVAIAEELLAAVTSREPAGDELRQAEGFGALLCESLAVCLPHDLILVLDDLHELDPASASIRLIETLCRHCPEQLHLVLVSRAEPPFPIGRLRGQGEVLELAAADLVRSTGELKELVRRAFGSDAGQLAEALQELTGGWPAAARMAIERMRLLKPEEREAALVAMREPEGPLISYLAEEIFASEAPEVVRLLRTVAFFDRFTVSLCHALGLPAAAETLAGLVRRGFFVQAHDEWFTLHPLVREFAKRTWEIETEEAQDLHRRAAVWFEGNGELEKALAALEASSDWAQLARVLSSRGAELLAAGSAESVIRYVEMIPEGVRDAAIERVLAEAHAIRGEPERALAAIRRATVETELLDPAVAWRLVQTYHLRDALAEAVAVYPRTSTDDLGTLDGALLCAWTASAYRRLGDNDACRVFAGQALAAATACGDDRALAAAHTAASFAAEPDRQACFHHLQHALDAAERAGDVHQMIRIRNNRGSLLLEESSYAAAIVELELAMDAANAVGYAGLQALTLMNRGLAYWCLGRLDEAGADYEAALKIYRSTGSNEISYALIGLGDVYRERGSLALARAAYEEGLAIAERCNDRQGIVPGLYQLAKVVVDDEPERAAYLAERAVSYGWPDAAWALNALGWVALVRGDRAGAGEAADRASAAARDAGDRFGLAESLELRALATDDPIEQRQGFEEALATWQAVGNDVHEAAAELALAGLSTGRDSGTLAARAARKLRSAGVRVSASGPAGLLRFVADDPHVPVAAETLGGFRLLREGRPVELVEWQSKKARDLLKLLVTRQGRPVPRERLMEALWPGEDVAKLPNRLSVALSTLRSVLDPGAHVSAPIGMFAR